MQVTLVELKDIQLPDSMKRAMARQAVAERAKRAQIIAAEGDAFAAGEVAIAADVRVTHPLALQLEGEARRASKSAALVAEGIEGSPAAVSADTLRNQPWHVLEPQYLARLARLTEALGGPCP